MMKQSIKILDKLGLKYECYTSEEIVGGVSKLGLLKDFLVAQGKYYDCTFVKILNPHICAVNTYHYWYMLSTELDSYDDYVFLFVTNLRIPIPGDTRSVYWNSCMQMIDYYRAFGWNLFSPGDKLLFESIFILRNDTAVSIGLVDDSQMNRIFNRDIVYPTLVHPAFYTEEELLEHAKKWDDVDSKVCEALYSFGIVLPEHRYSKVRGITMAKKIKYAFGIDLGTTNSCIAMIKKNSPPQVIPLKKNNTSKLKVSTLPSCVMYTEDGVVVGSDAYERRYEKDHVVYSSKRDIGSDTVYPITTANGITNVTPVDVAAEILSSLKHSAEEMYGEVTDVTITVPAYFEADARHATIEAANKAGLNVLALINEPTAAALNYASESKESERILVYDLGGGTFDVTLLDISRTSSDDLADIFGEEESSGVYTKVLSTGGNRCLGGDDLDRLVAEAAIARSANNFAEEHPDIKEPLEQFLAEKCPTALEKIILISEQIKKRIDSDSNAPFCDRVITEEVDGNVVDIRISFTESIFENAAYEIFNRTTDIIEQCFKRAQISYKSVDRVVLIGGSTKLGYIRTALKEFMAKRGIEEDKIYSNINPDEAVALGAAINSAIHYGDSEMMISDVLSQSIGIAEKTMIGDRISNDQYHKLITRNSSIPQSITYNTTVQANQTEAHILVYQGDDPLLENNTHIGTVTLTVPCVDTLQNVEITFMIDASGSLSITAESSGNTVTAKLENVLRPSQGQKKDKKNARVARFANSLAMYASPEDQAIGEDMISRFSNGDNSVTLNDIREFVNKATKDAVAKEQKKIQDELSVAASATNVFKASGSSAEDDEDSE